MFAEIIPPPETTLIVQGCAFTQSLIFGERAVIHMST